MDAPLSSWPWENPPLPSAAAHFAARELLFRRCPLYPSLAALSLDFLSCRDLISSSADVAAKVASVPSASAVDSIINIAGDNNPIINIITVFIYLIHLI